jgi:hypothetical protein
MGKKDDDEIRNPKLETRSPKEVGSLKSEGEA